jgi:hypothetical protein
MMTGGAPIVRPAEDFGECGCPTCARLNKRFPGQGVQLALFRYVISLRGRR